MYMKKIILILSLTTSLFSSLSISKGSSITVEISTYRVELLTKKNNRVTLSITAENENEVRRQALSQYPGATILSIVKLK
jgi:hypothetical protein